MFVYFPFHFSFIPFYSSFPFFCFSLLIVACKGHAGPVPFSNETDTSTIPGCMYSLKLYDTDVGVLVWSEVSNALYFTSAVLHDSSLFMNSYHHVLHYFFSQLSLSSFLSLSISHTHTHIIFISSFLTFYLTPTTFSISTIVLLFFLSHTHNIISIILRRHCYFC